jgi:hypothetical protein
MRISKALKAEEETDTIRDVESKMVIRMSSPAGPEAALFLSIGLWDTPRFSFPEINFATYLAPITVTGAVPPNKPARRPIICELFHEKVIPPQCRTNVRDSAGIKRQVNWTDKTDAHLSRRSTGTGEIRLRINTKPRIEELNYVRISKNRVVVT